MNDRHVGTCGNCGGRVMLPTLWHGVVPPEPTCESCGATAAPPEMPVMRMKPKPSRTIRDYARGSNPMHRIGYGRGDDE